MKVKLIREEIPENCRECRLARGFECFTGKMDSQSYDEDKRPEWCPLEPINENPCEKCKHIHGLWGREKIEAEIEYCEKCKHYYESNMFEPVEPLLNMRDATQEEQQAVNEYIRSLSRDTGIDFYKERENGNE